MASPVPPPLVRVAAEPSRVLTRRYHFKPAGAAYVVTTMVLILGAINGQNNLLFWLFGLGVAGLLISGVLSGSPLMGLRVRREVIGVATVGQPLRIRYHLRSRHWFLPAFALVIEESPEARSWFGRSVRGTWMSCFSRIVAPVPMLPPRGEAVADVVIEPFRRGMVTLDPFEVSCSFPFGLTRKGVTFTQPVNVVVRPCVAEVPNELLRPPPGAGATVGALTPARTGLEYFSLRDYEPGDSIRTVAWRVTARMDRPVVRTHATPPGQRLWIVLDTNGAAVDDVERIVSIAAGVATRGVAQGLEVGLVGPDLRVLEPLRSGRRQVDLILDTLALFDASAAPAGSATPNWRLSRAFIVHAGGAPSVAVPVAATTVSTTDPRIRVAQPLQSPLSNSRRAPWNWRAWVSELFTDPPSEERSA